MSHQIFMDKRKLIITRLIDIHNSFSNAPEDCNPNTKGDEILSRATARWLNATFRRECCGIGMNSSFRCRTIWRKMMKSRQGALFKTGLRIDRFNIERDEHGDVESVTYRIFLETHNTDADTDMSNDILMHIEFKVLPKTNYKVSGYSFVF